MALVRCPECGRGVSDTAAACPGCTSPIGGAGRIEVLSRNPPVASVPSQESRSSAFSTDTARLRKALFAKRWLLAPLIAFLVIAGLVVANFDWRLFGQPRYSDGQREAAQGFWDTVVDQYLKLGLITHYGTEDRTFVIYVRGSQWRLLSKEDKRTFLANVSRSNEILGRTSRVEIRDNDTGIVYGVLNPPLVNEIYE